MTEPPFVETEDGTRYRIARRIGSGGQGAVYAIEGGRLAAKLILDYSRARRELLREQLAHVRRLPLDGLPIALPLALLRAPHVGYVMELLTGMQPLQRLIAPTARIGMKLAWYRETGGVRRRLRLLARVADCLTAVHGKGLAYGDPSPSNIFVSEDVEAHEIRLIDADNLRYRTSPGNSTLHTRCYGAPELVNGTGAINTLTDAYGFAVIAFEALTLTHPLLGDAVLDGDPDEETAALCGELPWIDEPDDARNRSRVGLPREVILSRKLRELCQATFGPGLRAPEARPGLGAWAEHLHVAARSTLRCPACHFTYYFTMACCPACDAARPRYAVALLHLWDPASGEFVAGGPAGQGAPYMADFVVFDEQDPLELPGTLAYPGRGAAPVLHAVLRGDRVTLTADPGLGLELRGPAPASSRPIGAEPVAVRLGSGRNHQFVHFAGTPGVPRRVLCFQFDPGGSR